MIEASNRNNPRKYIMASSLYKQLSAKMALAIKNESGSGFAQAERMYSAKFLSGETRQALEFTMHDLAEMGFTLYAPDFSFFDELSPCEFDSDQEYAAFVSSEKAKMMSLVVIPESTCFAEVCNYKGEGVGFVLESQSNGLPVFVSKEDSFNRF